MKKCASIVLLTICLLLSLLTFGAAADDAWNGTNVDTDWYEDGQSSFTISSGAELAGLAQLVNGGNSFSGKTITLGDNIDLGGHEWTPIGQSGKPFQGTFDGATYIISNLYINNDGLSNAGLFGIISSPATVKNVTVNGADITAKDGAGALFGSAFTGTVEKCKVTGTVKITAYYKVGGMAGEGYARFTNCSVEAAAGSTVTGVYKEANLEGDNVGGLIGYRGEGNIVTEDCSVTGLTVTGTRKVAGLIGSAFTNNKIENCSVSDIAVTSNASEEYITQNTNSAGIGGIVGVYTAIGNNDGTITDCKVENITLSSENPGISMGYITGGQRGTDQIEELPASENWTQSGNVISGENSGGNTGCVVVGSNYYATLPEAIRAAMGGTDKTVELLGDITVATWEQVWNITGITLEGNGHTLKVNAITSGENHDTVFHSAGGNTFSNLTIDLSGISVASQAQGYKAICSAPGDKFDNITVISGTAVPVYGIFVGGTDAEDETITITNCKFENCCYAVGAQPTTGTDSNLENLVVTGCTFTNCDYVGILYATDVTFTGNTVDSGKLNIMHPNQTVTDNSFTDGSRIKFYTNEATVEKNSVSADSKLDANTGVSDIDVSKNYWGGGAPSDAQLNGVSVTGNDEFYLDPSMDEEDLNTYVPPCTVTIVYGNGQANVVTNHKLNDQIPLPAAPTKSGYIFMGWKCGGEVYAASETVTVTGNMTFYAVWANMPDVGPTVPDEPDEFPFTDVSAGSWYYDAVYYVWENGLMNGTDTYKFSPNSPLTRAMVWAVLARIDGVKIEGDSWMTDAQKWAVAKGVSDGTNPTGYITREQLVTMLWRYKGSPAVEYSITAPDAASISDWAVDAMKWAASIGLIEGDETGALNPASNSTRAHAATFFMRFCK